MAKDDYLRESVPHEEELCPKTKKPYIKIPQYIWVRRGGGRIHFEPPIVPKLISYKCSECKEIICYVQEGIVF